MCVSVCCSSSFRMRPRVSLPLLLPGSAWSMASAGNFVDEAWQQIDVQKGTTFTDRHQLRSFPCLPLSAGRSSVQPLFQTLVWRRVRLRITSTANPEAANSVQLAAWNLYGPQLPPPLEQPVPLLCSADVGGGGSSSASPQDVGLQACQQAARQVVLANEACLLHGQHLELLHKVARNVGVHPEDPRFRWAAVHMCKASACSIAPCAG